VRIGGQAGIRRQLAEANLAVFAHRPHARQHLLLGVGLQLLRDLARILRGQGADLEIEAAIGGDDVQALPPLITPVCTVLNGGSKRAS
jgi:hypothetical protein